MNTDAGHQAARTLAAHGVGTLFTLNGGHLWPLYYGTRGVGIRLVDTRHEQTAGFAAEGWAKVTRRVGAAALTAGPGVTNGVSALTTAHLNGSPVVVVGGRAPQGRWGVGSLQELDHVPIVASITKRATTARSADAVAAEVDAALTAARTPHRGPTFVDVPLDAWGPTERPLPAAPPVGTVAGREPDPDAVARVARLVAEARRPVLFLGGDVYWAGADAASDHAGRGERDSWVGSLRDEERARRAADEPRLHAETTPIDPVRVYGELAARLDRDAVVVGDGGDFVSYAGRYVDTFTPGCFLGPGPYGCLGVGMGYALAAALAHPDRQVVALFGDGALGFTLGDLDTLARHHVSVTAIVGNNGIWGLEKHPMQALFGYDVVAELSPGIRYDQVVTALGGSGELVTEAREVGPALDRAFSTPGVSLVNVLTDPADAYPRSSNLA